MEISASLDPGSRFAVRYAPLAGSPFIGLWSYQTFAGIAARLAVTVAVVAVLQAAVTVWVDFVESSRIELDGDRLVRSNTFGSRVLNPDTRIIRIIEVNVAYPRLGIRSDGTYHWVFVDTAGNGVLCLSRQRWEFDDLERLRTQLGIRLDRRATQTTWEGVQREFPGALSPARRPTVLVVLVVLAVITAVWHAAA
jgi:hypothetical protein